MRASWIRFVIVLCLLIVPLSASDLIDRFADEVRPLVGPEEGAALGRLVAEGRFEGEGADLQMRPIFVGLQAAIEQTLTRLLATGEIAWAHGIIHTPTPATPCCMEAQVSPGLIDPQIEADPDRLATVVSRASIVRSYLAAGGTLTIAYPAAGIEQRSPEQRSIYKQLLESYPDHAYNLPLLCEELDFDAIGATYIFEDGQKERFLFSIRAPQANAPSDEQLWVLWFGSVEEPVIEQRVKNINYKLTL